MKSLFVKLCPKDQNVSVNDNNEFVDPRTQSLYEGFQMMLNYIKNENLALVTKELSEYLYDTVWEYIGLGMKPNDFHRLIMEQSDIEIKLKRNCIDDGELIDGKLSILDEHNDILYRFINGTWQEVIE